MNLNIQRLAAKKDNSLRMAEASIKRMANQIAANLKNRSDANESIKTHLKSVWTPKMIAELKVLTSSNPEDFEEIIVEIAASL